MTEGDLEKVVLTVMLTVVNLRRRRKPPQQVGQPEREEVKPGDKRIAHNHSPGRYWRETESYAHHWRQREYLDE